MKIIISVLGSGGCRHCYELGRITITVSVRLLMSRLRAAMRAAVLLRARAAAALSCRYRAAVHHRPALHQSGVAAASVSPGGSHWWPLLWLLVIAALETEIGRCGRDCLIRS